MEMRGPRKALETAMLDYMLHRLPARFAISTVICAMVAATFAEGLHGTEEFVADVLGRMKLGQDIDPATLDRLVDICESALDSAPEDARAYPLFLKAARGLIDYSPDDIEGRLGVYYAQSELVKKILGRQYIIHGMSGQKKTGACPRFFFQLFWIHDNGFGKLSGFRHGPRCDGQSTRHEHIRKEKNRLV